MVQTLSIQQVLQLSPIAAKAASAEYIRAHEVAYSFNRHLQKIAAREGDLARAIEKTPSEVPMHKGNERRRRSGRRVSDRKGYHRRLSDRGYQRRTWDRGLSRRASDKGYLRRATDKVYYKRRVTGKKGARLFAATQGKGGRIDIIT